MIWAKAKMPMRTGRNWNPERRNSEPKLSRGTAMIGSAPMTVTMRPIAPERNPLRSDFSVRPATIASAKTKSEKYSHGPNWSANFASGIVPPIRKMAPRRPPIAEAQVPSQSARPGCPLRVMGKPSKVVAIAEGVPGIPRRHAVTSPPAQPPT